MSNPPKRGPGRPKGSKNPPGAKNVGRPRKNGEPPRPRINRKGESHISLLLSRCAPDSFLLDSSSESTRVSVNASRSPSSSGSKTPVANTGESSCVLLFLTALPTHASETAPTSSPSSLLAPVNEHECDTVIAPAQEASKLRSAHTPSQTSPTLSRPLVADLPAAGTSESVCTTIQHEPLDLEQEHAATPLCRPSPFNIYGSDLEAADVLEDEEALDVERPDEFMHGWDEDDDDSTNATKESTSGSGAAPPLVTGSDSRTRSSSSMMPTWLAGEYQRLRERLTAEMKKNVTGLPQCYQANSFYNGVENQYLAARSTFQLSASLFHQPRFFVWLPHLLVDKIPCPACCAAGRQPVKSSRVYLQKHGFADYSRRVVDIDQNMYIVGYRYACGHKDCGKTFLSWSPAILDVLPPPLRDQFTFRLTHRSGLTSRLVSLLQEAFNAGVGPEQFTTMIEAAHYRRYDLLQCQFLEMVLHRSRSGTLSSLWTTTAPFGAFGDRNGYAGFVPGARYVLCQVL